jgi:Pyruvate/2-oxoacid:ferredoxin oxidoreductase delta subunit
MPEDVYRRLARRLDAIPNGFPSTESGVELRLLAKIFTPQQASLAAVMRLTHEPAEAIAARAGVDAGTARRTLKGMARQGLIYVGKGEGQLTFALMPFAVGVYEEQLPRMDVELAQLFEEYLQQSRGNTIYGPTPLHRVIPVEEAVPVDMAIYPYERASELIKSAKSWAVRDCICRVQKRLIEAGCDHVVENCLVFAPVEGAFERSTVNRATTKDEALRILRETEEAGLVHTTGNYRDGHSYICNCCGCCCGILRGVTEFGILSAVGHSDWRAAVDVGACAGCGDCLEWCQFSAISLDDGVCVVDNVRCVGCGQCATACPNGALQVVRRPEHELPPLAADRHEWMAQRARARGISLSEIQ